MNTKTYGLCLGLLLLGAAAIAAPTNKHTISKSTSTKNKKTALVSKPATKAKTKRKQGGPEQATTIAAAHFVQNAQYSLTGNNQGLVTLSSLTTGAVVRTFQMDAGVQVREVFLLDSGATVGASQKDHTVFWNVATGNQLGRVAERVYGFNHAQTECFTQNPTNETINLFGYPNLNKIGTIASTRSFYGPEAFLFSPDDHYLSVQTNSLRPESDGDYPNGVRYAMHSSWSVDMFDLQTFQANAAFSDYGIMGMGTFSADSRFYNLTGVPIISLFLADPVGFDQGPPNIFQFDLTTGLLTKLP